MSECVLQGNTQLPTYRDACKVRGSHPKHSQRVAIGILKRFGGGEVTTTHLSVSHLDLGCLGVFSSEVCVCSNTVKR